MEVLDHTFKALRMNMNWIVFFSVPFLLAFTIPLLTPLPSYIAMGGTFLRTGSIPNMSGFELGIVILASLLSIFFISFALVSINILIKHKRTFTQIPKEVIDGIENYTLSLFWILVTSEILYFVVYLIAYEYSVQNVAGPLFTFIVSLGLFYAPAAIVIDDMRPFRAVQASFRHIYRKPMLFFIWMLIAFIALMSLDILSVVLKDSLPFGRYLFLVVNSVILLPFLIVFQTQIYLTKYTILK
ncbi:MAG: hypothetical protein ABIG39_07725 [Candidatus Micrarchaeota archaeon]